jgi:hypothetical protein
MITSADPSPETKKESATQKGNTHTTQFLCKRNKIRHDPLLQSYTSLTGYAERQKWRRRMRRRRRKRRRLNERIS